MTFSDPPAVSQIRAPGTKKWLIVGGAAAAVVVFGAVLIPFLVSGNHAKTAVPPPAPSTSVAEPPPAIVPTPAPVQPAPATRRENAVNQTGPHFRREAAQDRPGWRIRSPSRESSGKCDLTESEIPKTLDRAEHYLHAGQLEEAQVHYERVVGCPAAHEKAQAGLKLVKQRIETQGSSGP